MCLYETDLASRTFIFRHFLCISYGRHKMITLYYLSRRVLPVFIHRWGDMAAAKRPSSPGISSNSSSFGLSDLNLPEPKFPHPQEWRLPKEHKMEKREKYSVCNQKLCSPLLLHQAL